MSEPVHSVGDIHQDEFASRLRHAVAVFGGASALARAIGRSEGAIRKWLRGDSEPNVSDLRAICRASGASVDWLVTGQGDSQLIPAGVREGPHRYNELPQVDDTLLETIITAVDEEAEATSAKIAANKKSAVVTTVYALALASGTLDRITVARLVRLAV